MPRFWRPALVIMALSSEAALLPTGATLDGGLLWGVRISAIAKDATARRGLGQIASREPVCRLRVFLTQDTDLSTTQLALLQLQVDEIWRQYGIAFDWTRGEPGTEVPKRGLLYVVIQKGERYSDAQRRIGPVPLGAVSFPTPVQP